ncbi:MAG: hypothetical protein BGN92_03730 [Sphingobacteriales bacterium 41-5]|nr:MAG: hypothetical protein BGN92_03730 [Sphingobacteriales bacterium 41-5]
MRTLKKILRTCPKGHQYYKSSDCPTCPVCEAAKKPTEGFMAGLSAPAVRALQTAGMSSLKILSQHSKKEVLALHGIGPSSIPKLGAALKKEGLDFKN